MNQMMLLELALNYKAKILTGTPHSAVTGTHVKRKHWGETEMKLVRIASQQ